MRWDKLNISPFRAADLERYSSESSNYSDQRAQFYGDLFRLPSSLLSPSDLLAISSIPTPTLEDAQDFCWKTCPIYCFVNPDLIGIRPTMLDFVHAVWRCWFQGDATNVKNGNFFGKCISCWPNTDEGIRDSVIQRKSLYAQVDIPALIVTHLSLCTKIKNMVEEQGDTRHLIVPLFEKVIIVMDTVNWDWEGLCIVRSDQAEPLRVDVNNFDMTLPKFRDGDQGQLLRARLEDVVRLVEAMRLREAGY